MNIDTIKRRIRFAWQLLRWLPWTLWFNFYYLPWKQAYKMPILLYRPKLQNVNGLIRILGGVKFGMIRLGFYNVNLYPNSGIVWSNFGKIVFEGACNIGNASVVTVGKNGVLTLGKHFRASSALKLVCYNKVAIGQYTLIGWDNLISDTDFHALHYHGQKTKGYGEVNIGAHNWFAMQSIALKGSGTPNYCVLAARTLLSKDFRSEPERLLLSGQPAKVTGRDIYHDDDDDTITYTI